MSIRIFGTRFKAGRVQHHGFWFTPFGSPVGRGAEIVVWFWFFSFWHGKE